MRNLMLPQSVHTVVTSPPYFGLRDYGTDGQIGLEPTPEEFVAALVEVFREVRRVLRDDGTVWLNLGDSYAGSGKGGNPPDSPHQKQRTNHGSLMIVGDSARQAAVTNVTRHVNGLAQKQLIGIPWRVAFALQADGWYLRQDIIWHKPNPMPESVTDRCTKAHEYVFLLSKSPKYYFDSVAIKEPAINAGKRISLGDKSFAKRQSDGAGPSGNALAKHYDVPETRNRRSVWTVTTKPFKGAHFATFPPDLIEPCILAGCPEGGTVYDPFGGAGTTALVALKYGRNAVLSELNLDYVAMAHERIRGSM